MARTARSAPPPSVVRIVRYWALFDRRNRPLACELCRASGALELRCGADTNHPDRTVLVENSRSAFELAEEWRTEYLGCGAYSSFADSGEIDDPSSVLTVFEQRSRHKMRS